MFLVLEEKVQEKWWVKPETSDSYCTNSPEIRHGGQEGFRGEGFLPTLTHHLGHSLSPQSQMLATTI